MRLHFYLGKKIIACIILMSLIGCSSIHVTEKRKEAQGKNTTLSFQKRKVQDHSNPIKISRKIGIFLPLTGKASKIGNSLWEAAQLALFDNEDPSLSFFLYDTQGTIQGAQEAMHKAIEEGVELIIGPLFKQETEAIASLAGEKNIPILSFSNDQLLASKDVFILGLRPSEQMERILSYAFDQGVGYFAILVPDNEYGTRVAQQCEAYVAEKKGELVHVTYYKPHEAFIEIAEKLNDIIKRTKESGMEERPVAAEHFDRNAPIAFIIPEGGAVLHKINNALTPYPEIAHSALLLGSSEWNKNKEEENPTLRSWYVDLSSEKRKSFEEKFLLHYKKFPLSLDPLAYDAVALAITLHQRANASPFSLHHFTEESGFLGEEGIFRFQPHGITERGWAVFELRRGKKVTISPAPTAFKE